MRTERKALDRTLAVTAQRSDVGRRLMTIPGVGPVTTPAYVATIDDLGRFPRKRSKRISASHRVCINQAKSIDPDKSASAAIQCCDTSSMRLHRH
jgi:transposase